jgi:adenylate kinase
LGRGRDIILLGAPGAGKGTQAEILSQALGVLHLSTGDILRANVAAGTELGAKAKAYMDQGDLVPDGVVVDMVANRLREADCAHGVLFDGFPRTLPQAEALTRVLEEMGRGKARALAIEVGEEELIGRLSGRRVCRGCARIFHVDSLPAGQATCPDCGGELYQRSDDSPEPIRQRLRVYAKQTEPLLAYYESQGGLSRVDGTGTPERVAERALAVLGS